MPTLPIMITRILPDNSLQLDDNGHTDAHPGDKILWHIGNGSGVDAITAITGKNGSANIFTRPPYQQGNNWVGEIIDRHDLDTNYSYSITWRNGTGTYVHDPIISVRPSIRP